MDFIRQIFGSPKEIVTKKKGKPQTLKRIFEKSIPDKGPLARNACNSTIKKDHPVLKQAKSLNRCFTEEAIWVGNKHLNLDQHH